jgi:hypothetical protein
VLVVIVLYVASFGPACWFGTKTDRSSATRGHEYRVAPRAYWPFGCLLKNGPEPMQRIINRYATLGAPYVLVPVSYSGIEEFGLLRPGRRAW